MFSDATLGKASSIPTDWKLQLKHFNQIIFKPRWIFWSMFKWNVPDAFVSLAGPARCVTWTSTTARRTPAPTAASASTRSTTSPASAKPASPESAASTPSTTARPSLARTAERAQVSSCWHFPCLQFMTSQVIAERTRHSRRMFLLQVLARAWLVMMITAGMNGGQHLHDTWPFSGRLLF